MRTNILFRIRLAVLVCATICYIIGLFTKDAYQTFFLDTSILLLALHLAITTIEKYLKIKEAKNDEKDSASH